MGLIEDFFADLDRGWKRPRGGRIPLRVIGSAALMLGTGYERRTKDGDVIETDELTVDIRKALLDVAGKGADMHMRWGIYLDIVIRGLPFLPRRPVYHPVAGLKALKAFDVHALDVTDVVVTKLMRFNANDASDVKAMVDLGLVKRKDLVQRFESAVDNFSMDARAEDLPRCIRNLNTVERDHLRVPESKIDLPDWMGG